MTLVIILFIVACFSAYCLYLKMETKKLKNNEMIEMLKTLPEDKREEFIAKHLVRYYREVQYDKHLEKVLADMNDIGRDDFLLDYHREYFSKNN